MIELLSEDTIQKIAAGEVIERPGSIVKELVENSIDAGSNNITVEIEDGGKSYIKIIDNGSGIPQDQIHKAFARHATSKLKEFNDLYEIYSLGFRGEALASIIAVADVSIKSKTEVEQVGSFLQIQNGKFSEIKPIAMNRGTTIEVIDLFKNVPVRLKFLRKDSTEANVITNMMYRFAIAHTDISFKYIKDNRVVFETIVGNRKENLSRLFDSTLVENLIDINIKKRKYTLHGLASNNHYYRGNRGLQYLYINQRYIENKDIQKVIEDQYQAIIPNGKYPVFQMFLELDPSLIDVNIHPNKQKVKINIIEEILEDIKEEFSLQLRRALEIPKYAHQEIKEPKSLIQNNSNIEKEIIDKVYGNKDKIINENYNLYSPTSYVKESSLFNNIIDKKTSSNDLDEEIEEIVEPIPEQIEIFERSDNLVKEKRISNIESIDYDFPPLDKCEVICTLFNTYILLREEGREYVYFIDQHAAHERILYENYSEAYNNGEIHSQQLLAPIIITLTDEEINLFDNNKEIFVNLGFEIDLFDENHIALRALPIILGNIEGKNLLIEILDQFETITPNSIEQKIIMKSCKAAVKGGDKLSNIEIDELLKQLSETKFPYTCPHGRPTIMKVSKTDIEKQFSRIK